VHSYEHNLSQNKVELLLNIKSRTTYASINVVNQPK
ncbi:MAG: hypothetical protein ACI88H_001930, partial [Cocleimonas sp.]